MNHAHLRRMYFIVFFASLLLFAPTAAVAQSCDALQGFGAGLSGSISQYCDVPPKDIYQFGNDGLLITCKGCIEGGLIPTPHSSAFAHLGNTSCTRFSKEMVIEFSQPVANVSFQVFGARRVRDNLGHEFHLDPPLAWWGGALHSSTVFIPGPGITSITISEPIEYDYIDYGNWEMWVMNGSYMSEAAYRQCNCSAPAIALPTPQTLEADAQNPWSMDVEVSADSGLVVKNVRLNGRYMAERMSVPSFSILMAAEPESNEMGVSGKLQPNGGSSPHTRLVYYNVQTTDTKRVIEAKYIIDQIPYAPQACVLVTQRYEFYAPVEGDNCEPSHSMRCARWKPIIEYNFRPANGDQLKFIHFAQRFHFQNNGAVNNTVGLFRDCDFPAYLGGCIYGLGGLLFYDKLNPVEFSLKERVIHRGKDAGTWDNFHLTFNDFVDEPGFGPGCPECVHLHWRWGKYTGGFGDGKPLIPVGSNQSVDIGVKLFVPPGETAREQENEIHSGYESIRTSDDKPLDVSLWYWSTGHQPFDTFSPTQGGFFNPSFGSTTKPATEGTHHDHAAQSSSTKSNLQLSSQADRPESVTFADLYEDGDVTYTVTDPSTLGSLPAGYTLLANDVFNISTAATVSGPHIVTFEVPSITDESTFATLRILRAEPDSFDPAKIRLIDRTLLDPQTPGPDFANRKISAKVNGLGVFLLTTFSPPPPNTDSADLSVNVSHAPTSLNAGMNLTYSVSITNNGPQAAHEVMLKDLLPPEAKFISVSSTAGTCRKEGGHVLCTIDTLASGNTATVTIETTPSEGRVPFPPEGKSVVTLARVKANETDPNPANNSFIDTATVLPDNNAAPTISLTTPANGFLFAAPASITLTANASDSDGTIERVEFYENGNLLGTETSSGGNDYNFAWNNPASGNHRLMAVAIDNLGKTLASEPVNITVNGSATVSIVSPANFSHFDASTNISVTANASISGGTISKVDFYSDGKLLGTGTLTGTNQYSLTWTGGLAGRHVLTAVATDNSGLTTVSLPVNVTVNDPPAIRLLSPTSAMVFNTAPATIPIVVSASDWGGAIRKVDFYANGSNIGTLNSGPYQFNFTWHNVQPGTYSVTAVATDDLNATSSTAPISIRVNAAPAVSISSPATGSQFAAPANITITANATDPDGTIASVAFFADGASIGNGVPVGGNQYSLTWSDVGFGSYAITAVATDNEGKTTSTNGPTVSVTAPALLVTGSVTLNESDTVVKTRLEALGHTVVVKDGASAATTDATNKSLIVISSAVNPTSVGTKFRAVTVPVITWESGLFNSMGMTGSTNKDFGTKTGQTQIAITNATHPLAAGLSNTVSVVTAAKTFDWGKPNANAISIATITGDAAKTAIFAYEGGVTMPGLTAPARRVALFLHDDTAATFTTSGTALLDAAIKWARGGGSLTGTIAASPVGSVNLTSEGILDWAHWGRNGTTAFDHKAGVPQKITNITKIGSGALNWFNDCPAIFSWSDGTPTTTSNTPTGINTNGSVGNGFEISIPADKNLKTLRLYVGVWYTQGKLEATLSDGSAPPYVDTSQNKNNGGSFGSYTIRFKAASSGQTLKVRFTILNQYFSPNGVVSLEAATLQ